MEVNGSGWKRKKVDESGQKCVKVSVWVQVYESGYKRMKVDQSGQKWMKVDERGWNQIEMDGSEWMWMKEDESVWKWMKEEEGGWKWAKVCETGWKWMKVDLRGFIGGLRRAPINSRLVIKKYITACINPSLYFYTFVINLYIRHSHLYICYQSG